jgi:PAS domain-containing protein
MRHWICPNCHTRAVDDDGLEGLSSDPLGCHHCDFGYMFEILEDFFPPEGAGFVTCDPDGRILSVGRGFFELTGFAEHDLLGKHVAQALSLGGFENGQDPVAIVLEWGVRKLDLHLTIHNHAGMEKQVRADFFPGYGDADGMMICLAPRHQGD